MDLTLNCSMKLPKFEKKSVFAFSVYFLLGKLEKRTMMPVYINYEESIPHDCS